MASWYYTETSIARHIYECDPSCDMATVNLAVSHLVIIVWITEIWRKLKSTIVTVEGSFGLIIFGHHREIIVK